MIDLGRLRWRYRRGMLELDLVFGESLEHAYQNLDRSAQAVFSAWEEEAELV